MRRSLIFSSYFLFAATLFGVLSMPSAAFCAETAEVSWTEDFKQATAKAKKEHKPIFLFFTGSDWCPWCKRFDKEIASTTDFKNILGDAFIFVKADFPQSIHQSPGTKEQNEWLKKKYGIKGFPTVVLLDKDLGEIGRMGYESGGGKAFAEKVQKKLQNHQAKLAKNS